MKNLLLKTFVLILGFMLVSCSTNTRNENTGLGAVAGAAVGGLAGSAIGGAGAIAAGVVGGAIVGGLIGNSADSSDNRHLNYAMQHNSSNRATYWVNKTTGVTYKVVPTSPMMTINGNPNCREYYAVTKASGHKHRIYGTACLQSDGTWRTISRR